MKYQSAIFACLAIALLGVVAWLATGMHGATHWECKRITCETNQHCYSEGQDASNSGEMTCKDGRCHDAFGDSAEAPPRWETCYEFGLTPSRFYVDGVLPLSGSFGGLAVLLFILGRRRDS